jgi:hypothetical protein
MNGRDRSEVNAAEQAGMSEDTETKKIEPLVCHFHDLRHTAVSANARYWCADRQGREDCWLESHHNGTLAARYGAFAVEEARGAVESISRPETTAESPVFPPVSESRGGTLTIIAGLRQCMPRAALRTLLQTETESFTAAACHYSHESGCIVQLNRCRVVPAAWDR